MTCVICGQEIDQRILVLDEADQVVRVLPLERLPTGRELTLWTRTLNPGERIVQGEPMVISSRGPAHARCYREVSYAG